eukprot:maker-scaffold_1-snap-gene-4.19-mRNA-1 protein AED:0.00 eAED:0.00 QI:108/1/0.66/1/0.5/0.33/3/183/987
MSTPPEDSFQNLERALGIDQGLLEGVKNLEEMRQLVREGRLRKDVYERLEADFLRRQNQARGSSFGSGDASVKLKSPKRKNKGIFRNFLKLSPNVRRRGSSVALNDPFPGSDLQESLDRKSSKTSSLEPQQTRVVNTSSRLIIQDKLLRLARNRRGQTKWRPVYVILYDRAIVYYSNKRNYDNRQKPLRSISFDDTYFINEVDKEFLSAENLSDSLDDESKSALMRDHVFLVSNLEEKYYFAAEDEEKKQYWLSMVTAVLKDLRENHTENQRKLLNEQEHFKEQYKQRQRHQTMRNLKLTGEPVTEEVIRREESKWEKQAAKFARQSVALQWNLEQQKESQKFVEEQEKLLRQLEELRAEVEHQKLETEKLKSENIELKRFRLEANERNRAKEDERKELAAKMQTLKRLSVNPLALQNKSSGHVRDFEAEIEILQTKLKALESALNVDMSKLDWDGTLEDAEEKMKALIPKLSEGTDKEMQEAQAEFDQWDQIIRNHAGYIEREAKKWEKWESDNAPRNRAALAEMKTMVPENYKNVKDLIAKTGVSPKIADRIKKNQIFKFFYFSKDQIARIHDADLLNKYAPQGLDIRETRAIYATLPDEFLNDPKGTKKQWREMIKNRLFKLTEKEAKNTLTPTEQLANAYRKKAVVKKPVNFKPAPVKRKKNNKMQQKALLLGALLDNKGSGPPIGKKPAGKKVAIPKKKEPFNPKDPKYDNYKRMMKRVPEGAVLNALQRDGHDPSIYDKLKGSPMSGGEGGAAVGIGAGLPQPARSVNAKNPMVRSPSAPRIAFSQGPSKLRNRPSNVSEKPSEVIQKAPRRRKTLRKKTLRSMKGQPKSRRNTHKSKRPSANKTVLASDADELINKALVGTVMKPETLKGNHGIGMDKLEYQGNIRKKKTKNGKKTVQESIQEVIDMIKEEGAYDEAEKGLRTIRYGDLFRKYKGDGKDPALLVGLLIKAKRQKRIRYRGDMLFKGIHDEIKVTVEKTDA